jgi:hypothetical protein
MIIGYYNGWNVLTVEDSFKITAWESIYSSFADDPLFLSISNFVKICKNYNINVDYPTKHGLLSSDNLSPAKTPVVILISGYTENGEKLIDLLKKGANLLYIKPEFGIVIRQEQQIKFNDFEEWLLKSIGLDKDKLEFSNSIQDGRFFHVTANQINDYQIEDGPFGKVEQSVVETKIQAIRTIAEEISRFSIPLIDLNVESIPSTFPLYEPFLIDFSFRNVSDFELKSIVLEFQLPKSFEPITSTYWEMANLRSYAKENILVYCKPTQKGEISEIIKIEVVINGNKRIELKIPLKIKVIDNFGFILRKSIPHNIDTKKLIEKYHTYFNGIIDQDSFLKLIEIDPEGVVAKVRKISEHLSKKIAKNKLENFNHRWRFSELIKRLFDSKVINNKIRSYLETIRIFGNIAAHSDLEDPVEFSHEDSIVISNALLMFIQECLNNNLFEDE